MNANAACMKVEISLPLVVYDLLAERKEGRKEEEVLWGHLQRGVTNIA